MDMMEMSLPGWYSPWLRHRRQVLPLVSANPRHRCIDRAKLGGERGGVCRQREAESLVPKPNDVKQQAPMAGSRYWK